MDVSKRRDKWFLKFYLNNGRGEHWIILHFPDPPDKHTHTQFIVTIKTLLREHDYSGEAAHGADTHLSAPHNLLIQKTFINFILSSEEEDTHELRSGLVLPIWFVRTRADLSSVQHQLLSHNV